MFFYNHLKFIITTSCILIEEIIDLNYTKNNPIEESIFGWN